MNRGPGAAPLVGSKGKALAGFGAAPQGFLSLTRLHRSPPIRTVHARQAARGASGLTVERHGRGMAMGFGDAINAGFSNYTLLTQESENPWDR